MSENSTKKSLVVAFAFGVPATTWPNRVIARIASKLAHELDCSVYTQQDIETTIDVQVVYTEEILGEPPPTLRIARGAVKWAKQNGITDLWVMAASPHRWRALRDTRAAVRESGSDIEVHVCTEIRRYKEWQWFSPFSTQARTRSRGAWLRREFIVWLMPFWLYKKVAS